MHFMYHTTEVVSPLCFVHLVPGSPLCVHGGMFIKSTPMRSLRSRVRILHDVSLAARASFWQIAHPLLRSMDRDASRSPQH